MNSYNSWDVVEVMRDKKERGFLCAIGLIDLQPVKASRVLSKIRAQAIRQIVKNAPLVEAVIYERKQMECAA